MSELAKAKPELSLLSAFSSTIVGAFAIFRLANGR